MLALQREYELTKKRAFVTGASGFIGIHIVQELVLNDWDVIALHRPSSDIYHLKKTGAECVEGDITKKETLLEKIPSDIDALFHVAGNVSFGQNGDKQQNLDNVDGTINVLSTAIEKKVGRLIYTSTGATWGLQHDKKIDENSESNVDDIPINYFRTKKLAENAVLQEIERGLDAVILNPANVVGAYDRLIWSPFVQAIANGTLSKIAGGGACFCHVEEVARAHVVAFSKGNRGQKYLLAGSNTSFYSVAKIVASLINCPPPKVSALRDTHISKELFTLMSMNQVIDDSKAMNELNFKHRSIVNMYTDLVTWMVKERLIKIR